MFQKGKFTTDNSSCLKPTISNFSLKLVFHGAVKGLIKGLNTNSKTKPLPSDNVQNAPQLSLCYSH